MCSFFYWAFVIFCQKYNIIYVIKHLEMAKEPFKVDKADTEVVRQFIRSYLKADGIFAIRMLGSQAGVIFGADLVKALWNSYHEIETLRNCKSETDLTKIGVEEPEKTQKHWKFPGFLLTKDEKEKLLPSFEKRESGQLLTQRKIENEGKRFPSKEV
uniref:Uncharacterized protein n=1 Tax=Panagrolaimus sp. JU765 TaxID=591449 RepID=A0AC34QSD6_9BILA